MSESFGNGVSRTLSALFRQFQAVVVQKGKPPVDAEHNLFQQIQSETFSQFLQSQIHSGFFLDPTRPLDDFVTDPLNSNQFRFGQQKRDEAGDPEELAPVIWANVNGMVIPVVGTRNTEADATDNIIKLNPPPDSDTRIDFVFLEAWRILVAPNPSTANKPAADKIWKYGNVEFGQTNIDDDLIDPNIGFETAERVQIQYRIRVVGQGSGAGVSPALDVYPDGLDDPNVRAQGPLDDPSAQAYAVFTNMRTELGDPSLWRAGNGDPANDFGTIDGYVYAIPICAIFRRNDQPYVAVNLAGNPNQNGGFNRNPSAALLADPRDGAKLLTQASLINDLPPEQTTVILDVEVDGLVGSGFDDPNHNLSNVFMVIDDEIIGIDSIDTTVSPALIRIPADGRGRFGTDPATHTGRADPIVPGSGTPIQFFNTQPCGKFSDEVHEDDIFDMRRGVNLGDWDYERLLLHNVAALLRNRMRSTWKQSGVPGGDTEGVTVQEVDWLDQDGASPNPNGTEPLDGPDGIREIWSDAAAMQGRVTMLLNPAASMNSGFIQTGDDQVFWDVGADFKPAMFMNNQNNSVMGFQNGTTIFVYIGGDDGTQGARKSFRDGSERAVRFIGPKEHWKTSRAKTSEVGLQHPVTLLWTSTDQANQGVQDAGGGLQALIPAGPGEVVSEHPGPMHPLRDLSFEKPFIVLGGIVNSALNLSGIDPATDLHDNNTDPGTIPVGEGEIELPGINFDTAGDWYSLAPNGDFADDPAAVNFPLIRGSRTLYDLLTAGGKDETGASSELYLVLFGDDQTLVNNGAFQVIGAGTVGFTTKTTGGADRVRVRFVSEGVSVFDTTSTGTLTAEGRSMTHNAEDGEGSASGPAAMTITLTDIEAMSGGGSNPWNEANINPATDPGKTLQEPFDFKLVVNTTLLYHPGRPAMARVPDQLKRVTINSPPVEILRQSGATLDPDFPGVTGAPGNPPEANFTFTHIQLWNRLPSLGLDAPVAPAYGGNVVLNSEITRETEAFFDRGSKTILFRPFQDLAMTMKGITITPPVTATLLGEDTVANPSGSTQYPNPSLIPNGWDGPKDDAQIFTSGLQMGYAVPPQWMPRFGRQDIPYYQDNGPGFGTGRFLEGINHLFTDGTDPTNPVFDVIGGEDNTSGGNLVTRFLLQTGTTSGFKYGQYGTITGPTTPAYQGRLTATIGTACAEAAEITAKLAGVTSSDFGVGLSGIMFPPYLGPARIYGVYDRRDFVAQGGVTFDSDRVTPLANRATNLLRRDATKQTLFICEDGAFDLTGERGDHTYIIPFNAIDIEKSPNFMVGETPDDLEYVVEFTAFGFSHGWINENNFVMARRHNGEGTLRSDGDNPELENIRMTIPHAAPDSSTTYTAYERTVYQGDPYMSRAGSTRTTTDYETDTPGVVAQSDAFGLATPIQQFDSNGDQIPERPNARSLQVLASLDFYTTMGSGNIGGTLYPGTETDVGYTIDTSQSATRIPPAVDTPPWRVLPRAFTEGQKESASRAMLELRVDGNNATFNFGVSAVEVRKLDGTLVTFTAFNGVTAQPDEFDASSPDEVVVAKELADKINARTELLDTVFARNDIDDQTITFISRVVGDEGNGIRVSINDTENFTLFGPKTGEQTLDAVFTTCFLAGGVDLKVNGGSGTSKLDLTGMTERFPLGILIRDQDFLGENPLGGSASAVQTTLGGIRPSQKLLPLTMGGGDEFTPFTGGPGELVGMGDGGILQYTAFDADTNPGGSKRYRIFRGGGSIFVLSGNNPGGPIDWISSGLEPAQEPVLKGGLLNCKALLVRNFIEEAFSTDDVTTEGDEIQMIVMTSGVFGNGTTVQDGVELDGIISPTGYGEGLTSSDRYRIMGKPMYQGRTRVTPDPETIPLAPFAPEFRDED